MTKRTILTREEIIHNLALHGVKYVEQQRFIVNRRLLLTLSALTVLAGITFWLWYYSELYRIFL